MAVKKVDTKATKVNNEEVKVETPIEEVENVEVEVEETPEVEVETPVEEETEVEVDTENVKVDNSNKPDGNVKIRMRVDHKCCIAMERYDLKEGKTYVVPTNVKRILNDAGVLAPL